MQLTFLKAKLHQATVTHSEPDYDGSCAIDIEFLNLSGILPFEQIQIYNISNGERLTTYAIAAEAGSRIISMNGAAALKAAVNDRVIICAYTQLPASTAKDFVPCLVYLNSINEVRRVNSSIAVQTASDGCAV